MRENRRKTTRMPGTAFLKMPITLCAIPPYFGDKIRGSLIDLSAGGIALVIKELIPQNTKLSLKIRFPDGTVLESVVLIKRVSPRGRMFLHAMEFLSLPRYMANKIENMSTDYIDCENRIQQNAEEICLPNCAFYGMCTKPERKEPVFDVNMALEFAFKELEETKINS